MEDFAAYLMYIFLMDQKCGTTWVTFIAHCLRTRGGTDFNEITEVVPCTIFALDCGQNLEDEQVAFPRLFKVIMFSCTLGNLRLMHDLKVT